MEGTVRYNSVNRARIYSCYNENHTCQLHVNYHSEFPNVSNFINNQKLKDFFKITYLILRCESRIVRLALSVFEVGRGFFDDVHVCF